MSDKLVFDLAQEIEGSPNVFVRKDWINILDNQNQNYNNNQSVLDTSQLSNSNKYMSYREAYLSVPLLITLASIGAPLPNGTIAPATVPSTVYFNPAVYTPSYAIGLKNWYGQIIHSFTLDYNGTTICQQTPYINFWNSFKLMTSLSLGDIKAQGATIGFYPDDASAFQYFNAGSTANLTQGTPNGYGTMNNNAVTTFNLIPFPGLIDPQQYGVESGNSSIVKRFDLINFDLDGYVTNTTFPSNTLGDLPTYSTLISGAGVTPNPLTTGGSTIGGSLTLSWKSYISNKVNATSTPGGIVNGAGNGCLQYSIVATIYLKHIHSFFNMCPLLKGVFMKMTMTLNNTSTNFSCTSFFQNVLNSPIVPAIITVTSVSNPQGGVNPLMISAAISAAIPAASLGSTSSGGSSALFPSGVMTGTPATSGTLTQNYIMNVSVGASCLNSTLASLTGTVNQGQLSRSVYLYIPAYTFNPIFEQAYLSNPVKQIKYTDVYQYQVLNIAPGANFNNLLTNGIANVKSVLILPFYSTSGGSNQSNTLMGISVNNNTGFNAGIPVWQSPFDTAGTGTTSPLCALSNFNVQVSGQNAIYNIQRYNFEQFNNQLYGQNSVNGGLTDGITSSLVDRQDFDMSYCYYYVNIERMLPVEETVPKSIQVIGQNFSAKSIDLYCFIEYAASIAIDCLTGARV